MSLLLGLIRLAAALLLSVTVASLGVGLYDVRSVDSLGACTQTLLQFGRDSLPCDLASWTGGENCGRLLFHCPCPLNRPNGQNRCVNFGEGAYIWSGAPRVPPPSPPMVHGPGCHPPPPPCGWGVRSLFPLWCDCGVLGFWVSLKLLSLRFRA